MKKCILYLVFVLALIPDLNGQNSLITGKAIHQKSLLAVDSIKIDLLDSTELVLKTVYTDKRGRFEFKNLQAGEYALLSPPIEHFSTKITGILLNESDTIEIDIEIKDPCQNTYNTNICPFCNSSKKVLEISPGTVISYNFGNNLAAIKKYERKIRRQGYKSYFPYVDDEISSERKEIIVAMFIESEREKFYDFCHHWFCKRCKKVF